MPIAFSCPSCKKKYQVKDALAGKSAKCGCGHRIAVPAGGAPAPARSSRPKPATAPVGAVSADLGDFLDEELAVESPTPAAPASCPSCGGRIPGGGVLCVACGYDMRSGRQVAKAPAPGAASRTKQGKSRVRAAAGASTTLATGAVLSSVGALFGAVIWAAVAYFLNLEIGYIAWGLGGLAGIGMAAGHRGGGTTAGLVAAAISIGGILVAKSLIIYFLVGIFIFNAKAIGMLMDPIDGLFALFAVATAYQLGSAGSE